MAIEVLASLSLLVLWTLISICNYFKQAKKKQEMFYSNILPLLEKVKVEKGITLYPRVTGIFRGLKISFVPYIDSMLFRRLPKLYLKLYLVLPNEFQGHLVKDGDLSETFLCMVSPKKTREKLLKILAALENSHEILFEKNYLKVTLPLVTAEKSYYQITRAAIFPRFVLQEEVVTKIIQGILALREELTDYAREDKNNTCLVNNSTIDACTGCGTCLTG